jgi:hypothetical protein
MENQITTLRLPDGRVVSFVDWSDKPLWSTIEFLAGTNTQELNFFQYVVGDTVPTYAPVTVSGARTAIELDTNLASPGGMADTEEMIVYAMRPEVFRFRVANAEAPDFTQPQISGLLGEPIPTPIMYDVLNARTTLGLEISQKIYSQAGFGYYNIGFGPFSPAGQQSGGQVATNGTPTQEAVRTYALPMHIGGTEKFRAFMTFIDDGTGNGIDIGLLSESESVEGSSNEPARYARIRLYLDGLYKRPTS